MAYAIVGTIGAVSQGTSGAAVTPSWGTSENRTANNLLLCWVAVTGVATLPTTPSGWSIGVQKAGTSVSSTVYYKIAAGSDAAPTIAAITSGVIAAQLAEFSGNTITSPLDQSGSAAGTTSPQTATAGAKSKTGTELIVSAAGAFYSAAATKTFSETYNNGGSPTRTQNSGTSTANHYDFAYGTGTGNASSQNHAFTYTTTSITGEANAVATFLVAAVPTGTIADNITTTDTGAITVREINLINIFDSITISESTSPSIPVLFINVFDSINVSEDITSITDSLFINIFDSITITEIFYILHLFLIMGDLG